MCAVCDVPFGRNEPQAFVDGVAVHSFCDVSAGAPCCNGACAWCWTVHAGVCVT